MYETFQTESKIKQTSEWKSWKISHQISQIVKRSLTIISSLSYVYRSAKFDGILFNFFARLFVLFYSQIYETFGPKVQ